MEDVIRFPINPASIEISESGQGKTYDITGIGEINVIKDRKLTEYSFSGLFPAQWYPFIREDEFLKMGEVTYERLRVDTENLDKSKPIDPFLYTLLIEKWMASKRPVRFIFKGNNCDINIPVSIESFQWEEAAGGSGDLEYTIKLKKYVFYSAKKIITETTSGGGAIKKTSTNARPSDKQQAKTYTLISGDSLWSVAKKQLGDGARWKEIQKLNNIKDSEVKKLPIGKVLMLP